MGEAHRTSEARMRAAAQDVVSALDRHGDALNRVEAITVLGTVLGNFALVWGGEIEVIGKTVEVAKGFVLKAWQTSRGPERSHKE